MIIKSLNYHQLEFLYYLCPAKILYYVDYDNCSFFAGGSCWTFHP